MEQVDLNKKVKSLEIQVKSLKKQIWNDTVRLSMLKETLTIAKKGLEEVE